MKSRFNITALIFISFNMLYGQVPPGNDVKFDELVQELFQQQKDDVSYEDLYESLLLYYTEPLDINKATSEELQQLYILSTLQINNFIEYRKNAGLLLSLYELQAVPAFDDYTIRKLLPFVTIQS